MTMAATPRCISSPAARPGRSESRCCSTARSVSRSWISSAARPTSVWACSVWTRHSGHERSGPRRSALCRHAGIPNRISGARQLADVDSYLSRRGIDHRSAPTSRRSRPTTTSESAIVSTTCTWTTGSRNGPTRAGASTSPATPPARSAPGRRPRTSTTSTRHFSSAWSAPRARAISTSCSPAANGSTRCSSATAGRSARSSRSISACDGSTTRS